MTAEQNSIISQAIIKGLEPLQKAAPQTAAEWADENFYLSAESSYIEGAWQTLPYQLAPLNCMGNDDIREVNFLKSARVGYTKMLTAAVGYFSTHKRRNQVIFQPTDGDAEDFVKDEVDPMLRDVPSVRANFPWADLKHKNNTLQKKVLLGATLNIRGGTSPKNYRRLTVDNSIYDELDAFDLDIGGEGDALTLGDKRIEGSAYRKSIRGSTPKIKGLSLVEKAAHGAEFFARYYVPCPHCNGEQHLKFGGKGAPYGLVWTDGEPDSVGYLCEHCGAIFQNSDLSTISKKGRYKTDDGRYTVDGIAFFGADDEPITTPASVGFHIWTIYSPMTTWAQIIRDFVGTKGDVLKLKAFVNTTLGETWEEEGDKVDESDLVARRETYAATVPAAALVLVAGVDVQDDRLEVRVWGFAQSEETFLIERRIITGSPGSDRVWQELDDVLFDNPYEHESGRDLFIAATAIDTGGHFTQRTYDYCKTRQARRVFAIKGQGGAGRSIISSISRKQSGKSKRKVDLYMLGVDDAKTLIYSRFRITEPGPGYIHLPEWTDDEEIAQLTAEKAFVKYVKGYPVREWRAIRKRNEALDCFVYALAAFRLLNPVWKAINSRFKKKTTEIAPADSEPLEPTIEAATVIETKTKPKKKRRGKSRGGFVNKW